MMWSLAMLNQLKLLGLFALVVGVASQSNVKVVATPSAVWTGHTKHLTVNCSFARQTADFSALSFLVLAKTDTEFTNDYKELATIPGTGMSNSIDVKVDLSAQVTGQLNVQGESFIAYQWDFPKDEVKGKYRCEAHGLDNTGRPISAAAITLVDGKVADYDVLVDMIQHVNNSFQDDTKYLEIMQWLQNHTAILNNQTTRINNNLAAITSLQQLVANQTTPVANNDTIEQINQITGQLASLKGELYYKTNIQAANIQDLQNDLGIYKAQINGQNMSIAIQTSKIDDLEILLNEKDALLSNQSAQINEMRLQLQGLLGLSSNQTSIQSAQLNDLQNQINSNKDRIDIDSNTIDQQNLTLILHKQQIDTQNIQINTLNRQLNNLTQQLLDQSTLLSKYNHLLDDMYTRINNSKEAIFQSSFTFGGHTYYLSKPFWRNVPMSESLCQLHGGHLVEIDTLPEMTALTNHLKNNNVIEKVFVAGSDEVNEGVWNYGRTGMSMSFFDWAPGFPSSSVRENCIMLDKNLGWKMENTKCHSEEWDRFVCEL